MSRALLLSGGMDSVAIAWWKRPELAITVDYGQISSDAEIRASQAVCHELGISHEVIRVDCRSLGSGDMAGIDVVDVAPTTEWWPFRNQLLITLVGMRVVSRAINTLMIGIVRTDRQHHVDGSPVFVNGIDSLMSAQEGALRIEAPAIDFSTAELVLHAKVPASILAWSHSCHKSNIACNQCRGCNKYAATFDELGAQYWNA